jgi:hypothetical protein
MGRNLIGLTAILAVGLVHCDGPPLDVDQLVATSYDRSIDFSVYETFAWSAGLQAPDPAVDRRIMDLVDEQLLAKGLLKQNSGDPDLYLVYYASSTEAIDVTTFDYGLPSWEAPDIIPHRYQPGTLIVDILDGQTMRLISRSVGRDVPIAGGLEAVTDRIKERVVEMLDDFPPTR